MTTRKVLKSSTKPSAKLNYATPALDKGLDVLELLAHQPAGLTKSQMARELNRTVSEIFRMLLCLERRGYIAQLDSERYSLTLKMFQLVQEHPPTERLVADALPVMQRFTRDSLQSCHLGVLEQGRVTILAQVNAPTSIGFYVKLGSTVDIMDAASGYVILAHQHPKQQEQTLSEWSLQTGKKPPRDLHAHLERIRKAGFEKRASYQVKGIVNISFPLLDSYGSALGALTVPYIQYSTNSVPIGTVTEVLRRASGDITTAIGGRVTVTTRVV